MEKYLVIITTILVLTQIIRLIQNAMQLSKMYGRLDNKEEKEQMVNIHDKLEIVLDDYIKKHNLR